MGETARVSKTVGDSKDSRVHVSLFFLLKSLGTKSRASSSIQLLDGDDSIVNNDGDVHKFLINIPGKSPSGTTLRC